VSPLACANPFTAEDAVNAKLTLNVEDLAIESFHTTTPEPQKGTVFGEQCTCYTNCTCPGCPTCDATCGTTCANTCDDNTCAASCNGTCGGATCGDRCYTGEPDTCWFTWCYGNTCN
jgi:hypothetical protein